MSTNIHMEGIDLPQTTTEQSRIVMGEFFNKTVLSFYDSSEEYVKGLKELVKICVNYEDYTSVTVLSRLITDAEDVLSKLDNYLDLDYDTRTTSLLFSRDINERKLEFPEIECW